jgi:hypothetical protein
MVLRPGSKVCITTVSSGPGKSTLPSRVAWPFLVPSKSKAPQQAISLAPWLASGVMVLPGRHRWWSGPARPPARAPRPTTVTANQLRPTAGSSRRSPPGAAKGRRAWSCVLPRTVGVRSRRLAGLGGGAGACCPGPIACPDVLGGGHIGQRDRLERPEAGLGAGPPRTCQAVGSSAGVIRRAWSLLPGLPHPAQAGLGPVGLPSGRLVAGNPEGPGAWDKD